MADRPILFSAPMIRALLGGHKTQTRRLAKPRRRNSLFDVNEDGTAFWQDSYILEPGNRSWRDAEAPCAVGDRLWTRENFRIAADLDDQPPTTNVPHQYWFPADYPDGHQFPRSDARPLRHQAGKLRPSIHQPRAMSRMWLTVGDVRLERLNAISREDAIAEGLVEHKGGWAVDGQHPGHINPVTAYRCLWNSLHGADAWAENPWVWVIAFSVRVHG